MKTTTFENAKVGDRQLWIRLFTREVYIGGVPMKELIPEQYSLIEALVQAQGTES